MEAVSRLHLTVTRAHKVNTNINFEVFIHKVDGLSDEHKIQKQRDIHKRANDDLTDAGLQSINLRSGSPHPPIALCCMSSPADVGRLQPKLKYLLIVFTAFI